jgi:iron complex outermembrane receptor protein
VRTGSLFVADMNPRHQFQLHSYLNLTSSLELDGGLYYMGRVPAVDVGTNWRFDLRLGWRPRRNLELSLVAQDLFDQGQDEWSDSFRPTQRTEIQPSYYGKATWTF